jgi:hypothetical protein
MTTPNKPPYEPTGKTYELKTYADFISLSDEQFAMMLPDFLTHKKFLTKFDEAIKEAVEMWKSVNPDAPLPSIDGGIIQKEDCFRWIDDGKHDTDISILIKAKGILDAV